MDSTLDRSPVDGTVVLYIEDDRANVRLVEHILRRTGDVEVISAPHGRRGLELARARRPDVILLDLHLPDMTGEEIAAALRADPTTHAIPIIVLTGAADGSWPGRLLEHDVNGYLTKPFAVADIIAAVERFAGRGRRRATPRTFMG